MGFRFFVDPGYLGRPLLPADSSGPVGPFLVCPGLVVLSVVLWPYWSNSLCPCSLGRPFIHGFVFPVSLCIIGGPGPVGPLMFSLFISVAFPLWDGLSG